MFTSVVSGTILAVSALSGTVAHAGLSGPAAPNLSRVGTLIDQTVPAQLARDRIPGAAVVVVAGGQTVFAQGYGVADVTDGTPVDPVRTGFYTGSVANVFTATAVAQLIQQGKLDPDADVNRYLKTFQITDAFPGRPVTVRNLLTHTSGFDQEPLGIAVSDPKSVPSLGAFLADREPSRVRPPGTLAAYDDYGVALAGYLVQTVSGEPFPQYMRDHVFGPLQMDASTFEQPHPSAVDATLAKGYRPEGGRQVVEDGQYGAWSPDGAGTVATATDVAKFMMAELAKDPVLGPGVADLTQRRQFTMDPRLPGMASLFEERPRGGQRVLFTDGDAPGFHGDMALLPDTDIGIYVVYNGDGTDQAATWDGKALINQIVDNYFPNSGPPPVTARDPKLGSYAGTYRSDEISRGDVTRVAGLVFSVTITANSDGTITTHGLSQDPHIGDQRWIPLGSGEFAEQGGQDRLVFDGRGHLATTIDPTVAYYKLAWYNSPELHLPMLYGGTGILAAAALALPVLALIRRLRHGPTHSRWARIALLLAGVSGVLATVFVVELTAITDDANAFYQRIILGSSTLTFLLVLNALLTVCTLGMLAGSAAAWRLHWWRPVGRIAYTLTALGAVSFLLVAFTYNLVWP